MKKYFILAAALFQFPHLFSQTYKINWENNQTISLTNGTTVNVPYFSNKENYSIGSYFLPEFIVELSSSNREAEVTNVQYREIGNELGDLDTSSIKEQISYTYYSIIDKKGQQKLVVKVSPFVKQNNKILKVESFSIVQKSNTLKKSSRKLIDNSTKSVLEKGEWFKIKVSKGGVFKLDRNFFTKNGIPTNLDPRKLKVYGNGEGRLMENTTNDRVGALSEIPIKFVGSEDGRFDNSDYVIFYAKGPHQWYRDESTTANDIKLRYNLYDDYAYYFISYEGENGKRVGDSSISGSAVKTYSQFDNLQFHEKDSINLNGLGQIWVGENLAVNGGFKKTFKANSIVNGGEAFLRYSLVGKNANSNGFTIGINGQSFTGVLGDSAFTRVQKDIPISLTSNTIDISVTSNGANPSGLGFLDYLQLRFKDNLVYNNEQFTFRFLETAANSGVNAFTLQNSSNVNVWNVADIHQISNIKPEGTGYKYQTILPNEFIAFKDENAFTTIDYVGRVPNQNIRSLSNLKYVIVTHPKFIEEANHLAQFRKTHDNIEVAVVTTDQVYNDFSSGSQDPIAIRDFFKFLKDNNNLDLEYGVLFGATTYDPKNRVKEFTTYLPTFTDEPSLNIDGAIATDDYFAMLSDDVKMLSNNVDGIYAYDANWFDIAVGRISAANTLEAKVLVDKIISYYDKVQGKGMSYGDWRTKVTFVSGSDVPINTVDNPDFDKKISKEFDKEENLLYTVNKIYTSAHQSEGTSAGLRYPTVNQGILNSIELGSNFVMYYGHGGPRSWSQERILTAEELTGLSNFNAAYSRLPIVCTVTCDFTVWDLPQYNSAGEAMLKNFNGGALAMITTNRPIDSGYGKSMNGYLIQEFFRKDVLENQSIGHALNNVKVNFPSNDSDNKKVSILGDPMLGVHRPKQKIIITSINNKKDVDILNGGIMQALDFVTIKGNINQLNSSTIDANFNGKISISLFDKKQTNKYLERWTDTFETENKTIYKGTGKVENGEFTIQFYVPKDINYEAGDRKIKFYAWDEKDGKDASALEPVSMEGINEEGLNDDERPQGKLYMNNLHFADGGITDRSPYLVGCLTDNTGINATGSSIGHDIVATIDGKVQDAYVLNEYYDGGDANPCVNKNFEDYQKGQVMYQLKNLELGQHTVNLKFWDINNNSNTTTLDFVVMENGTGQLHIDKLLNWPNPFTKNTYFHFEHNCDSELDVMVQIFTISGKLVKTVRKTVSAEPFREGYRTGKYAIEWDGLDDFGDKIGKGVYIYKVNVKGVDESVCKGSAAAVEKLVILK
ncbi:type IX secretion system sortase PorU [Algoriella sp.]|uniref:type IX secretion system sortase PorU n=2 Tax=Algoriella sp. TaxID=1872434 RepID=UPI002FC99AB3